MSTAETRRLRWWKSSRSGGQGGDCVEVATTWRKSSRSDSQGGNCVEVADVDDVWFVRDSKDPDGGMLTVSGTAWHSFLTHLKSV